MNKPIEGRGLGTSFGRATLECIHTESFSEAWFADASLEARISKPSPFCRREIVFAVCAIETYLFEWVRDVVYANKIRELEVAQLPFYEKRKMGIRDRWKAVLKTLEDRGMIVGVPSFTDATWSSFSNLVKFRDGLIHASVSQPQRDGQPPDRRPFPSLEEKEAMQPGWATQVAGDLIRGLHTATGTPAPEWLNKSREGN